MQSKSGLESIAIQINLRMRRKIDLDTIISILRGEADASPWLVHLHSMFMDIPISALGRFFLEHGIDIEHVKRLCDEMPETDKVEALCRLDEIQKRTNTGSV